MKRNIKGQFIKDTNGLSCFGFGVWYEKKGYPVIWINSKIVKLHVYVWEIENGEKPKGYEIHHKDFNKKNYELSNLELLTNSDHRKVHAGWIRDGSEWIKKPCTKCLLVLPFSEFYQRKGYTPSAQCKKCHCKQTKKWAEKNPEKRKLIANKWARKHWKEVMQHA